jgi:hypothetical protein
MSSKKCTYRPEKAKLAAENVRAFLKTRGEDFDAMVEESDKILKGLSDTDLKVLVKEMDAFAHMIKRLPFSSDASSSKLIASLYILCPM